MENFLKITAKTNIMPAKYMRPGIYIKEIPNLPSSVAEVETAIPAFIGFTEKSLYNGKSIVNKATRISSLADNERVFGMPEPTEFDNTGTSEKSIKIKKNANPKIPGYQLDGNNLFDPFPGLRRGTA